MQRESFPSEPDPSFFERHRRALALGITLAAVAVLTACGASDREQPAGTLPTATQEALPFPSTSVEAVPHPGMDKSTDPQLSLLATKYEAPLKHKFDGMMLFSAMPRDAKEAKAQATDMAGTLKEYARFGVKPLFVFEPNAADADNTPLDLENLSGDESVSALSTYFMTLKAQGITDEQMGRFTPLPEPNLPEWGSKADRGNTNPTLFAKNYATIANTYRDVFPHGELSVMLDSTAYPNHNVDEDKGDNSLKALMPYIEALKANPNMPHINSFGLQGFPWAPKDNPEDFVNGRIAAELAKALGVKSGWINTGTASAYEDENGNTVKVSDTRRSQILQAILVQAKIFASTANMPVSINLFGQDKLATEGAAWAYTTKADKAMLQRFATSARAAKIPVTLFVY